VNHAKTTEPIEILFGEQTRVDILDGGAYGRHLANTTERRKVAIITVTTYSS